MAVPVAVGWDVGGVNVKAARVAGRGEGAVTEAVAMRPFEIWRHREELPRVLAEVAAELAVPPTAAMALTMTAELSDAFRTKREGVVFVAEALRDAFPSRRIAALDVLGDLVPLGEVAERPLDFAATNWIAAARYVAKMNPDCLLVDMGSTTTDIIPIKGGQIVCEGRTDLTRLMSGELVYTGLLRTDPAVLARTVPVRGRSCRVSAERFALMADAYLLLGVIGGADYTCPTADGRGTSRLECEERLARIVCADRESLGADEVLVIARHLAGRQAAEIAGGLLQVASRLGGPGGLAVLPAGVGAPLIEDVARRAGLAVIGREPAAGEEGKALPACAVAALLLDAPEAAQ